MRETSRLVGRSSVSERDKLGWTATTQKALSVATGVSATAISNRSKTIASVLERSDIDWTSLLHSTQRTEAVRTKKLITDWRTDHPSP
jgi:hypothetical protein